jgi:hypothetical protein
MITAKNRYAFVFFGLIQGGCGWHRSWCAVLMRVAFACLGDAV